MLVPNGRFLIERALSIQLDYSASPKNHINHGGVSDVFFSIFFVELGIINYESFVVGMPRENIIFLPPPPTGNSADGEREAESGI